VNIGTDQRCTAEKYEEGRTCFCQVSNDFFLSNTTPADVSKRAGFVCLVISIVLAVGMLEYYLTMLIYFCGDTGRMSSHASVSEDTRGRCRSKVAVEKPQTQEGPNNMVSQAETLYSSSTSVGLNIANTDGFGNRRLSRLLNTLLWCAVRVSVVSDKRRTLWRLVTIWNSGQWHIICHKELGCRDVLWKSNDWNL